MKALLFGLMPVLSFPGMVRASPAPPPAYVIIDEFRRPPGDTTDYITVGMTNTHLVLGALYSPTGTGGGFLYRRGKYLELPIPEGALGTTPVAISERREDGTHFVVGFGPYPNSRIRANVWLVHEDLGPDAIRGSWVLSNVVLPEDSYSPGEQDSALPNGVDRTGRVVGGGTSYLAQVPLSWQFPYSAPPAVGPFLDPGTSGDNIRGIDDHGNTLHQTAFAGIFFNTWHIPGSTPAEMWDPHAWNGVAIRGGWAIGEFTGPDGIRTTWRSNGSGQPDLVPSHRAIAVNDAGLLLGARVLEESSGTENTELVSFGGERWNLADLIPAGVQPSDGTPPYQLGEPRSFNPTAINDSGSILLGKVRYGSFRPSDLIVVLGRAGTGPGFTAPPDRSAVPGAAITFSIQDMPAGTALHAGWKGQAHQWGVTVDQARRQVRAFAPGAGGQHVMQFWAVGAAGASEIAETTVHVPSPVSIMPASWPGFTGTEGGVITLLVQRNGTTGSPITLHYRTSAGTAEPGVDFVEMTGSVTIPAGAQSAELNIHLPDDSVAEPSETFFLHVESVEGDATYSELKRLTLLIEDNDGGDGMALTPFQQWEWDHAQMFNWADPLNDGDADGIPLILEYAFGTRLYLPDRLADVIRHGLDPAGRLRVTFPRRNATDVTYRVEASDDLATWLPIAELKPSPGTWTPQSGVALSELPSAVAGFSEVTVTDSVAPAEGRRRYLRLMVRDD